MLPLDSSQCNFISSHIHASPAVHVLVFCAEAKLQVTGVVRVSAFYLLLLIDFTFNFTLFPSHTLSSLPSHVLKVCRAVKG